MGKYMYEDFIESREDFIKDRGEEPNVVYVSYELAELRGIEERSVIYGMVAHIKSKVVEITCGVEHDEGYKQCLDEQEPLVKVGRNVCESTICQCKSDSPKHYTQGAIEPWDYIKENELDYFEGNVIKYVTRHQHKGGKQDLEKAIVYLKKMLEGYDENYPGT